MRIAKLVIFENNRLTIGEQKNAIQNFYNPLLTEFRLMESLVLHTREWRPNKSPSE